MMNVRELRRRPLRSLSPPEHAVIEVERALAQIRVAANRARLMRFRNEPHLSYLVGVLHGSGFAYCNLLIYRGGWDEFDLIFTAARNEADFLTGPYLEGIQ